MKSTGNESKKITKQQALPNSYPVLLQGVLAPKSQIHACFRRGLARRRICAAGCCTNSLVPQLHVAGQLQRHEDRIWYAKATVQHGRSRNALVHQIETALHKRSGAAVTNFKRTLPSRNRILHSLSGTARVVQQSRFSFHEAQIWYSRDPRQYPISDRFANVIVLSDEFYREMTAHPIPADLEAVKVLAGAPAVLDLFLWLSYRCFLAKGKETIPLFGAYGLASQLGSIEYARPRRFREKLDSWLDSIRVLWPECSAKISADGTSLIVDALARCWQTSGSEHKLNRHDNKI